VERRLSFPPCRRRAPASQLGATGNRHDAPLHSPPDERSIIPMHPRTTSSPTEGALRAATEIETDGSRREATANLIDRETGLRELSQILEEIIAEAGDLIECRSPELLAEARAALRRSADSAPRQAE
jgi:hypothetical protein